LLDNAIKFSSSHGTINITCRQDQRDAVIVVQDRGPGIPDADLPHVFERFFRARQARRKEGTGLGLSICHMIVTAHGGSISAGNRKDGTGAELTVRLPFSNNTDSAMSASRDVPAAHKNT
jgi:two-component system sensor histidine kinase KdpD